MALCSNCGHEKGMGSYCGGCGQRSGTAGAPPQNQPPQYQPPQYQPPQYQPPQYQPPQYGAPQYVPVSNKTNSMAIASLIVSLICCAPLGVIFGHVALGQIDKTGEGGRGLAVAGLIVGYIGIGIGLLFFLGALGSSGY